MPQTDKEFLIRVKADIDKAVADMRKLSGEIGKTGRESKTAAAGTKSMGVSLRSLAAGAAAYLSVATAIKTLKMADEWATLQQRIKTATKATGDYVAVSEELFEISQRNGSAMADTVATFQRLAIARTELQATNSEILKVTEAVQQLGRMSGASAGAMQAGTMQFAQAMSAGVVRAEEFNSILENIPAVANRIADGLGMTVGELRAAVLEGKVLSREVFDALLNQSGDIAKEMADIPLSMDRSWTVALNSLGNFLGRLDELTGVTDFISTSLQEWSGYLDDSLKPESELARLQENRLKILERIKRFETDTSAHLKGGAVAGRLRFLKIELEMLDEQIALFEKAKQVRAQGDDALGANAQSTLAKEINNTNNLLKDQTALFGEQATAVQKATDKIKSVQAGFADARKQLENQGRPGAAPDIISASSDILKAETLADQGDYAGAIAAAEAARDVIVEMGRAGTESELVLKGLLLRAEQAGVGAAEGIEAVRRSELEKTEAVITNLLVKAEELKALKVGFDADAALTEAVLLRASLQAEFNQHPLSIPVTTTKIGAALPASSPSAPPPVRGLASISKPGGDNVIKYRVEIDPTGIEAQVQEVNRQAQAAAGPVIIQSVVNGVPTFSNVPGSFADEIEAEVLQRGGRR